MAAKLASFFLGIAVVALFLAWQMQTSAGDSLAAARSLQEAEVPDGGAEPGDVDDYRAIVDTLDRSIEIRSEIDGLLGEVERIMRGLNATQGEAVATATTTRREIARIGRTLDGSVDASDDALAGLRALREKLRRSGVLARRIADELEELDESLGPPAARP
jgi:hypothetical protein